MPIIKRIRVAGIFWAVAVVSTFSQEGIVETFTLGKKVSPFLQAPSAREAMPGLGFFYKVSQGYESNVYRSPYHFDKANAGENGVQFGSHVNLPQSDMPLYNGLGAEFAWKRFQDHSLRFMLAGQFTRYPEETMRNSQSLHGYGSYRYDINRAIRLDVEAQVDQVEEPTALIFGTPHYQNYNDLLNASGSVQLSAYTVPATVIGRGRTELLLNYVQRDYGAPTSGFPIARDTFVYVPSSVNDGLEMDYSQYRGRLRHLQGLVMGYTLVGAVDFIQRDYLRLYAKQTREGEFAKVPSDTLKDEFSQPVYNGNQLVLTPTGPMRSQREIRAFGGFRFDPPHMKKVRFSLGGEHIRVMDDFQNFYSYNQWALKVSAAYRPSELAYTEFSFASKVRSYRELRANLWFGTNPQQDKNCLQNPRCVIDPSTDGGEPVQTWDYDAEGNPVKRNINNAWQRTKLEANMMEMSWRTLFPISRYLALSANYHLDVRLTNRLPSEYLSRDYHSQSFYGGLTLYFRNDK